MPSLNLQLEPHPVRCVVGGLRPCPRHTNKAGHQRRRPLPPQAQGAHRALARARPATAQAQLSPCRSQMPMRSVAWLRHTLWCRASDHTRDPSPGALQELPPARRYPAPRRGLVAIWPPRPAPTTCSRRLSRLSPEVSPPRTAPRSRPGGTGDSDEVCGRTYLLYSRAGPNPYSATPYPPPAAARAWFSPGVSAFYRFSCAPILPPAL